MVIQNPYDNAAGLYGEAADLYRSAGGNDLLGGAMGVGDTMMGMVPDSITQKGVNVGGYGPSDLNAALYGNMNAYLDPYYKEVLNAALGDMASARDQTLQNAGAAATAAGAFGGDRHGLVEGQIHGDFVQDAGALAANLKSQGFNNALSTAQGVLGMDLNRGQYLTGLQTQADLSKAQNDANMAMQLAGMGVNAYGQGLGVGANILGNADVNALAAARGLQGLGEGYYTAGNDITNRQYGYGSDQQALYQQVLNGSNAAFQQYLSDPYKAMDLMSALLANDPRQGNVTQTGTQTAQSTPGLWDIIGMGFEAYGASR